MEQTKLSKTLKSNWEIIALISGVAIVLSLLVSIIQPFQYEASTRLLIIQKQVGTLDAYTATKSAEKIGKNLTNIIYTSLFYNQVIDNNPTLESLFPKDPIKRRKMWAKNIEAEMLPETGIIEIKAFDEDKNVGAQIVRSIAFLLVNQGDEYHGGGSGVEIKVVDDVLVSTFPQRPNIVFNMIVSALVGAIVGLVYVFTHNNKKVGQKTFDFEVGDSEVGDSHDEEFPIPQEEGAFTLKDEATDAGWVIKDASKDKESES